MPCGKPLGPRTGVRRDRWLRAVWATGWVWLLAAGCGGDEEPVAVPPGATGPITLEESPDAAAPPAPAESAAVKCLDLAGQEDWFGALDPCTRAAKDHPDDPAIQHALERALEARDASEF